MEQSEYNSRKRKEEFFHLLEESVLARLGILSTISSLAAMLLVVATFNRELLALNSFVKFLLSLLLFLIPTSIFFYLYETNEAANSARKALEGELEKELTLAQKRFLLRVLPYVPWIGLVLISFVIFSIIFLIWYN